MQLILEGPRIGHLLGAGGRYTRGFDVMRVALAVSVLCWHGIYASYGDDSVFWAGPLRPLPLIILPMFFALSGFLVAGSLVRCTSLVEFFTLRAIRLLPALFFEVLLSALVLGPFVTEFLLGDYFSARQFYSYWLNCIGHIHYNLPGVFLKNPAPGIVNVSLWTVPHELECYMLLGVLAMLGVITRPRLLLLTFVTASAAFPAWERLRYGWDWGRPTGKLLLLSFAAGLLIYAARHRIPVNRYLFGLSGALSLALLVHPSTAYLAPFPVAYTTVFIGLTDPPPLPLLSTGDYSYGLYLYAFPMQQTYSWLLPDARAWWLNILFALPASFASAVISWHLVEKHILRRKKIVTAFVRDFLQARWRQVVQHAPVPFLRGSSKTD